MSPITGVIYAISGCLIYQLVTVNNYRTTKKYWPWQDKKIRASITHFAFGFIVKILSAAALAWLLVITGQISGPWTAFATGMVADYLIIRIANTTLKEIVR